MKKQFEQAGGSFPADAGRRIFLTLTESALCDPRKKFVRSAFGRVLLAEMRSDADLLREFTQQGSEPAFTELVQRHVDLVYSAALRQVGMDDHLARDVAQLVFLGLARKATTLADRTSLAGWLYTSTHYAAANVVRAERRRRTHELRSHMMHGGPSDNSVAVDWDRLRPVLDAAMLELSEHDREIVVQRFFGGRSFAEIGANLNINEDTARKRAERALDKLHPLLARRGIRSTSEALALALLSHAVPAAPSGLATALSAAAMSNTVVPLAAAAAAPFFTMSKLSLTAAIASLALLGGAWLVQQKRVAAARAELSALNAARATLAFETSERRKQVTQVASSIDRPLPPTPPSSPTSPASNLLARLSSPEQIRVGLDGLYAPLFRKLKFPADRLANFKELLVRKRQAALKVDQLLTTAKVSHSDLADSDRAKLRRVATREIDDQIRTFLGPVDAHTFDAFERTLSVRTMFTSPAAFLHRNLTKQFCAVRRPFFRRGNWNRLRVFSRSAMPLHGNRGGIQYPLLHRRFFFAIGARLLPESRRLTLATQCSESLGSTSPQWVDEQGASHDHHCHDPCSEQHGSRRPRSWLIFDVRLRNQTLIRLE